MHHGKDRLRNECLARWLVDHELFAPDAPLFRHFVQQTRTQTGSIYGRQLYEIMRCWDTDQSGWPQDHQDFAAAWRKQTKWVVSRSLSEVGPNATLVAEDLETAILKLKQSVTGEIDIGGPNLARSVTDLGLIDEYQIYLHPVVHGKGTPFFAGSRPPLRLINHDRICADVIRLTYVPA